MILHNYWRSGTSYRTRIALNLKGVEYRQAGIDLRAGAHRSDAFRALNPQGLVPALEVDGRVLTQSPALLEWIEERWPQPLLLPRDPADRAEVRAMAAIVACDIHPLNNMRALQALKTDFGADDAATKRWAARWITAGFEALERLMERRGGGWAWGDTPTLADCCLIPQVYSARRFETDLSGFPRILAVDARAAEHPAFQAAHPDRQPDAD
ncbi:MAG TPA: maleylacetoacetate isomerase [Caulobacteraceae bacterium]|nr:maleylacetoacetate isomerase [Caulobacteraceae bacterium]